MAGPLYRGVSVEGTAQFPLGIRPRHGFVAACWRGGKALLLGEDIAVCIIVRYNRYKRITASLLKRLHNGRLDPGVVFKIAAGTSINQNAFGGDGRSCGYEKHCTAFAKCLGYLCTWVLGIVVDILYPL
jgi:hypothetical protein